MSWGTHPLINIEDIIYKLDHTHYSEKVLQSNQNMGTKGKTVSEKVQSDEINLMCY